MTAQDAKALADKQTEINTELAQKRIDILLSNILKDIKLDAGLGKYGLNYYDMTPNDDEFMLIKEKLEKLGYNVIISDTPNALKGNVVHILWE